MFEEELSYIDQHGLRRRLVVAGPDDGAHVMINGQRVILMCSNDYLGLANHPALRKAACAAMEQYGFGSGASRLVSGTGALHCRLEERLAEFKGTEAALLFNTGYAANTGIIPAVATTGDVVLSDSLNHASIIDGCRLSKAQVSVYRHRDANHVEDILKKTAHARRRLIVTDGVFSMDGDIAPLPDLVSLAEKYNAILMVNATPQSIQDRKECGHFRYPRRAYPDGTWEKRSLVWSLCSGRQDLIDFLINTSRSLSTAPHCPGDLRGLDRGA
jgi:glycine C-acetyltransferase